MLNSRPTMASDYSAFDETPPQRHVSLQEALAAARRQAYVVLFGVSAVFLTALLYVLLATKGYTANSNVLLDPRSFSAKNGSADQSVLLMNSTAVDSQVEVIKSLNVVGSVIDKLHLVDDPEFNKSSALGRLLRSVFGGEAPDMRLEIFNQLSKRLVVTRVNKSFVIEIDFTSEDRFKAARIANAIAEAFVSDQVASRTMFAGRAASWLDARLDDLRKRAIQGDMAVQKFRESNNLVLANGRLVNDQQLADLNGQLGNARIETYRAQAKYNRIQTIIENREIEAAVAESLSSPVIVELRQKALIAAKRASELSDKIGATHNQVLTLKKEAAGYENQIFGELSRIKESYLSDLQIARDREKALTDQIAKLTGASADDNRTLVALNELSRQSDSLRTLYQSFLEKFEDLTQQQSSPVSEVRIIAVAIPPMSASEPRTILILPLALVGGLALGIGLGMIREYRDRTFRRGDQLRRELQLDFLGAVPLLAGGQSILGVKDFLLATLRRPKDQWISAFKESLVTLLQPPRGPSVSGGRDAFVAVLRHPISRMADTLRTVKVALDSADPRSATKIIGVVSSSSQEGKSVIASNLAHLIGQAGWRTLLIDGDLRRCGLSLEMAPHAEVGLAEVLIGRCPLASAIVKTEVANLDLLPSCTKRIVPESSEMLGSPEMRQMLLEAADNYEYVVVDLPPLNALVDARAIAPALTATLFVVAWGETPINLAREAIVHNIPVAEKCIGVVMNKVDLNLLPQYEPEGILCYGYAAY